MKRLAVVALLAPALLLVACGSPESQVTTTVGSAPDALALQRAAFTIDDVQVTLTTPILPAGRLESTERGASYQEANAVDYAAPFGALEVGAIPYGGTNPSLSRLTASSGSAQAFRQEIADSHTANLIDSHAVSINLFSHQVAGQATTTQETVEGRPTTRLHAEWVTEAGNRMWILRFSVDNLTAADTATFQSLLGGVQMHAIGLGNPTTVNLHPGSRPPVRSSDNSFGLGLPPWWDGQECDAGFDPAHTVMGSWNGLIACGPNVDVLSRAASGSPRWSGELEWECVELSKRYLWQRYGVPNQPADGYVTADNEARAAPFLILFRPDGVHVPRAGDVISFGTTVPGHTAVVTSSSVDGSGNGSYTTLNENVGNEAVISFDIAGWLPTTTHNGRSTGIPPVADWLHDPSTSAGPQGPGLSQTPAPTQAPASPRQPSPSQPSPRQPSPAGGSPTALLPPGLTSLSRRTSGSW